MSMALQARISALELKLKELSAAVEQLTSAEPAKHNPNGPRQMCPKCGEKPNYHLHVINCKGPSKRETI